MEYPSWQKPLRSALLETDTKLLGEKVDAAEAALLLRSRELAVSADRYKELAMIEAAIQELLRIKRERLGWPAISDDPGC